MIDIPPAQNLKHIDKTAFISGPMTGYPDYNHYTFKKAEKALKNIFSEVINPAKEEDLNNSGSPNHDRGFYLKRSLKEVMKSDVIVMLKNWQLSKGARLELHVAESLDLIAYELDFQSKTLQDIESPLEELSKWQYYSIEDSI